MTTATGEILCEFDDESNPFAFTGSDQGVIFRGEANIQVSVRSLLGEEICELQLPNGSAVTVPDWLWQLAREGNSVTYAHHTGEWLLNGKPFQSKP